MKSLILVNVLLFIGSFMKTDVWAFECDNGTIISDSLFCDRTKNCIDGSDEGYGCTFYYCGKGKFSCKSTGACLPIKARCDGIVGCEDQSDDQECGALGPRKVPSENCTLPQGKFHCKNELACLNYSSVCDGHCDCLDCSDEDKQKCALDSETCSSCTNYCLPTLQGPQCLCESEESEELEESENNQNSSLCKDVGKCSESTECTQKCFQFQNREYCFCEEGYHLTPLSGGRRCRSNDWYSSVVIYSTATKIKSFNLTTNQTFTIARGVHCTALAAARYYVYYAAPDFQLGPKNYIFKARINSDYGEREKIIESDSPITSIAVDYITTNIYFTDNESLMSCTNTGEHCTELICCGLSHVALAPMSGWMFYIKKVLSADQRELKYYLMKSNMAGYDETYFADDTFETSNVSFAVDEAVKRVLYIKNLGQNSANARLEFLSFDEETKHIRNGYHWGTISYLSVLDDQLFYSKIDDEKIYYTDNITTENFRSLTYFRDNSTKIMKYLLAHNPLLPHSNNDNPCEGVYCDGLCLLRSTSSKSGFATTCIMVHTQSSSEPSKADQILSKSHECSQFSFRTFFVLLVVVAVLGYGGYLAFQKRHLYEYYETMRAWKRNKRNPREEIVEELE